MNIYHRAHDWLEEQHEKGNPFLGSCEAIVLGEGWGDSPPPDVVQYANMFKPDDTAKDFWGDEWGDDMDNCRLLALAFAAAMRDAGDL